MVPVKVKQELNSNELEFGKIIPLCYMIKLKVMGEKYKCPDCGTEITEGSAMCSVCNSGIIWKNNRPVAAVNDYNKKLFFLILIIALIAFAISLTIIAR